jgi:hypothetical protein
MTAGQWLWHKLFGITLGYGYQPWRAALLLGIVFFACATVFGQAAEDRAMIPRDSKATAMAATCTQDYPCFNRWMYAFDVTVPLISVGQDAAWRPDVSRQNGRRYQYMFWAGRFFGWIFATLAVASLAGLVRKE